MIMLKAMRTIGAWLVKFQKEVCHGSDQLALEINSDKQETSTLRCSLCFSGTADAG